MASSSATTFRVALLGLALAACRTPPWELGAAGDGGAPADLARTGDLSSVCNRHQRRPTPLVELRQLNPGLIDPGVQRHGSVLRFRLGVPLRPCEALADVERRVMPGNATDFVVLTAYVWRSDVDCGPEETVYEAVGIIDEEGLSSPNLVVGDGAPGGTATLRIAVPPRPVGPSCATAVPIGGICDLDCQCRAADKRALCILDSPRSGRCAIPCSEDVDCPEGQRCGVENDYTCRAEPSTCGTGCGITKTCDANRCRPVPGPVDSPCGCDRDCPFGRLCSASGFCFAPCATTWDCPGESPTCTVGLCR